MVDAAKSNLRCARCNTKMAQVSRSRPQGQAICHPCRREIRAEQTEAKRQAAKSRQAQGARDRAFKTRTCSHCGTLFDPKSSSQRFCSRSCWHLKMGDTPRLSGPSSPRPPKGSTTARGYGHKHQRERRRWVPIVKAGEAYCWRCGGPILPDSEWDLGHDDDDRSVYRGPEHPKCNRAAGARKGNSRRRGRPRRSTATTTSALRW